MLCSHPSSSSDPSPVLPHGEFGFLKSWRLKWSTLDWSGSEKPWVRVSKNGRGYIIFFWGGEEVKDGKTPSKIKVVLIGRGSRQRQRSFSGNTQTWVLCDNTHLVPMAFGRENMILGFPRHSASCRLRARLRPCFGSSFTCLKASWNHWGSFWPSFPAFVNWV